jgi:hypothetical protein
MQDRRLVSSGSPFEPTIGFSRALRVGDRVLVADTAAGLARRGERLLRVDHLSGMKHGGTERTETHGGPWREPDR